MNKNNYFTFSLKNFMIRYGILFVVIEFMLIWLSIYLFPTIGLLIVALFFIFLFYLKKSREQYITIDPFQIRRKVIIDDRTPSNRLYEKKEQYCYINKFTNYKINYFYITIYGDVDYIEKYYNITTEKHKKNNHIKIYRGLNFENEFIEILKQK